MAGIVRRIDELGRIVIPKELRRTMVIRNGEQLEMTQVSSTEILVKKFSQLEALKQVANGYCEVINSLSSKSVLLTDKMSVLAACNMSNDFVGEPISNTLFNIIMASVEYSSAEDIHLVKNDNIVHGDINIFPVVASGEVYGSFVVIGSLNAEDIAVVRAVTACTICHLE